MNCTSVLAALLIAAILMIGLAGTTSAHYDPTQGRFISRDPTASVIQPLRATTESPIPARGYPRIGKIMPDFESDPFRLAGRTESSEIHGRIVRRDSIEKKGYPDGPNLYLSVRINPQLYLDPYGLMPRDEWDKCCKDNQEADRQLAYLRTAALAIDGYPYRSVWRGEVGCGWCAMNILNFLSSTTQNEYECLDFNWYSGTKWMIGTGYGQLPDLVGKHHFVALRKNIDGMLVSDPYNADSPVFDGWGGLLGNITGKCRFSDGSVRAYDREWSSWRIEA